jgi:hypothetical protein
MCTRAIAIVACLVVLAPASHAAPRAQVRYVGIHPIPKSEGGGICYIEGPHVHSYKADPLQYRLHDTANYFIGDPVAYGYDGPKYAYKGPHPIEVDAVLGDDDPDVEYCYLEGPHYHYFAPPPGPDFKHVGDAYYYVGTPSHAFVAARPRMVKINALYQPLVYERPHITIEAPIGWIGARAEFAVVVTPPRPRPRFEIVEPEVIVYDMLPPPVVYYEYEVRPHHGHWR